MVNLTLSTTILLPALAALGIMNMVSSFNPTGLFPAITSIIENPAQTTIPGTNNTPLTRHWTGIAPIDELLTTLVLFFVPVLSGRDPAASLQGLHFAGQFGAYWTLILLETSRPGNKHRLIAYTTVFGMLNQTLSLALALPLWSLLYLLTQPPPSRSHSSRSATSASDASASTLPYAITLGYLLPTLLMSLPSFSPSTHQLLILLWQPFPLYIAAARKLLQPLFADEAKSSPSSSRAATSRAHLFALTLATVTHVATLTLSVSAAAFPSLFSPDAAAALRPASVFLPRGGKGGLAEAAAGFLVWDEGVSCAAVVVWVWGVYGGKGGVRKLARVVGWSLLGGPAAGAVAVGWAGEEE